MRRRYKYFLLFYFHSSSKKAHITKYSIKSTINISHTHPFNGPFSGTTQVSRYHKGKG